MNLHTSYKVSPDDPAYDAVEDLQISLGGNDEHAAIIRVTRHILRRIEALEGKEKREFPRRFALALQDNPHVDAAQIRRLLGIAATATKLKVRPSGFFQPLPGPQESFVRCVAPEAELEGPPGSGKTAGLIMAALTFLDDYGDDRTHILIVTPGPIPFSGAWTFFNSLAPALKMSGSLISGSPDFQVRMDRGIITFVDGSLARDAKEQAEEYDPSDLHRRLGGMNFAFIGVDRVNVIPPANFAYLKSRLRGAGPLFLRTTRDTELT